MNRREPPDDKPYRTWGRSRSVRLRNHDYTAPHACLVTFCTAGRRPVLSGALADALQEHLATAAQHGPFRLWAWCIMPDHVHVVVEPPGDGPSISEFVRRVKGWTTARARHLGVTGALWQKRFHDHVLRPRERPDQIAAYIVGNPVRKHLIRQGETWPWAYLDPEAI